MNRLVSACLAATLLAASPAAAQYPLRGGPIYGGPFVGGGPSLFTGAFAPPSYPYPIPGAGFGPSYLGAAPYTGGYQYPIQMQPAYYMYTAPPIAYPPPPKRRDNSDNNTTPGPSPGTPGGPAEGSRSGPPAAAQQADEPIRTGRAHFTVTVPSDAKVWVNDAETKNVGAARRFHTPATLEAGKTYEYTFRAQWNENGQPVTRDRTVQFKAGNDFAVDFAQATGR
jgi:uncharacterized protein (TIGR03000 family)